MMKRIVLRDALEEAPTHEARLLLGERILAATGRFPWGLANPHEAESPALSAAILLASAQRVAAGLPPLFDVLNPWVESKLVWMREPVGISMHIASAFRRTLPDGSGWMLVTGFGQPPVHGPEHSDEGRAAADLCAARDYDCGLLDGDDLLFWLPEKP